MNDFETMMNSASYANMTTGYPAFINVNSFIDYFIVNELGKNVDAYRLSTYVVKESIIKGGKLSMGPVWDFDLAWHNCNYASNVDGWAYQVQVNDYPSPTWWTRFMQDPNFMNQLRCRWNELRQNILSINYLHGYIDANANAINEAQERNFRQWPVIGAFIYPNPQSQVGASYWSEVTDLKNWLTNRIAWLDANMPGDCAVGIQENVSVSNLKIYPNPMGTSTTFSMKLAESADISLCITDIAGKEVARYLNANTPEGDSKIIVERNQMQAGIYFYQLQINSAVKSGKIIIQ
jgi:hypothetical protein